MGGVGWGGGVGRVAGVVRLRVIGKRESFLPDWWVGGLRGVTPAAIGFSAAVLLGDMVVVIAGVISLFVLIVEVVVHVAVAVVEPQLLLLDPRLVPLQAGHVGVLVVVGVGLGAAGHARVLRGHLG